MSKYIIKALEKCDIYKLYQFDKENCAKSKNALLNVWIPNYYDFVKIIENVIEQEKNGESYIYIYINDHDKIFAIISVEIKVTEGCRNAIIGGSLGNGYRMKGHRIDEMIEDFLKLIIKKHKLNRVEANTSVKVIERLLIKIGFQYSNNPIQDIKEMTDDTIFLELIIGLPISLK